MSIETAVASRRRVRVHRMKTIEIPTPVSLSRIVLPWLIVMGALAIPLIGGGNEEAGSTEARIGLAAGGPIGPLGEVYGSWDVSLLPGKVLPAQMWCWGEGGIPTTASIRWPSAIAALIAGSLLVYGSWRKLGATAAAWTAVCWGTSIAIIDRSESLNVDFLTGLWTIAALERSLSRGCGLLAGIFAGLAFLAGGWTPVAIIMLVNVIAGRPAGAFSWRFLLPLAAIFGGWSYWTLSVVPTAAWAAVLTLPFLQKSAWFLILDVLAGSLPWTAFALLAFAASVRSAWGDQGRSRVSGWLRVSGVSIIAGTIVPGLAAAARAPAIAGLIVAAAASLDRVWSTPFAFPRVTRRITLTIAAATMVLGVFCIAPLSIYLALTVGYYRQISIFLAFASIVTALVLADAAWLGKTRRALGCVVTLALLIKIAHFGVYVPEINYRTGEGPRGRAIGQWAPPHRTIFTVHPFPADLMLATRRPVRDLPDPRLLKYQAGPQGQSKFVLLHPEEFKHWPEDAPPLEKVFEYRVEFGHEISHVLARTKEPMFK